MAQENDVVLIYFENQPAAFARIEEITPDVKRGWYLVKLLLLQVPLQVVTWILRDVYIDGQEYTMNGNHMRLEKVVCPGERTEKGPEPEEKVPEGDSAERSATAKVISLSDLKSGKPS